MGMQSSFLKHENKKRKKDGRRDTDEDWAKNIIKEQIKMEQHGQKL